MSTLQSREGELDGGDCVARGSPVSHIANVRRILRMVAIKFTTVAE